MFLLFSPFSFLLSLFYLFLLFSLFSLFSPIFFWLVMELLMLVFIGLSYSVFSNSFSSLVLYFLIQTVASFSVLLSYLYSFSFLLCVSFMLKLSIFPFHFWFLSVVYRFPRFILFLSSSFHKLPIFLFSLNFSLPFSSLCALFSILISVLLSSLFILSAVDFRILILSSSVGNNSWLFIASLSGFYCFFTFFVFYSFFLFLLLFSFSSFSSPVKANRHTYLIIPLLLVCLSGLPPLPLFYPKLFILYQSICLFPSFFIFFFLVFARLMLVGYVQACFKFFVLKYSSIRFFFIDQT